MSLSVSGGFWKYGFSFVFGRVQEAEPVEELTADQALNRMQVAESDRFTRIFEVAEGRRQAMLSAGWMPEAAQACAAMMVASMIQGDAGFVM